ncbi:hypothetical protein MD484_g6176, partial [Candolleomyces efflorescens]
MLYPEESLPKRAHLIIHQPAVVAGVAGPHMVSLPRTALSLVFLWIVGAFAAADIKGRVLWNDVCANATALGRAKVVLDSGSEHAATVTQSGRFLIALPDSPDVPVGTYILSVVTHDYTFDQLRIDVLDSESSPLEVRPYIVGTPLDPPSTVLLPYPITLSAKDQFSYFSPPESFNIVGMLTNPMAMMMVFGAVMMFSTPYLMKNLDPEALEELKEQQSKVAGVQSAFASGDFKSGVSAIMSGGEPSENVSSNARTPQKSSKGSKRAKR